MPRGASTLDVGPNNLFLFLWGIRPFQAAVPQVWETLDECLSTFLMLLLFNMVTMLYVPTLYNYFCCYFFLLLLLLLNCDFAIVGMVMNVSLFSDAPRKGLFGLQRGLQPTG